MEFLTGIDFFGTLMFAMSGTLVGIRHKLDLFGAAVIAFVASLGGGTIRDLLIGRTPVGWIQHNEYIIAVLGGFLVAILLQKSIQKFSKTLFLFDSIGIGLFTILGIQITLEQGINEFIALLMGVVSAVFGGLTRDVLVNRVPLILRKEIYATACILGGSCYLGFHYFFGPQIWVLLTSIATTIAIRILAVRFNWSLPVPRS